MILFVLSVALNSNRNLTVALGAVSTSSNPFWSQRLPAFHYCSEDQYQFSIEYSYNERKIILPFSNEPAFKLNPENFTHTQCRQFLSSKDIKEFERLAVSNSFLRFYVGKTVIRTPFFSRENGNLEIFTHYTITIDNSTDTESPYVSITQDEPTTLKKGSEIIVSFSFRIIQFSEPTDSSKLSNKENFLKLMYLISITLFVISILASYFFYRMKYDTHDIPVSEVWRIPPLFNNTFLFVLSGMIFISCGIYLYLLKDENDSYGEYIQKIIFPSVVVPATLYSLIAKTLGINLEMHHWTSPIIIYFFAFVFFPHAYTVFFGFFGSFRGFRIRFIVLNDPFFLGSISTVIAGAGPISYLLISPRTVDAPRGETYLETHKIKLISQVFDLIYVLFAVLILTPVSNHLFEIFFDDKLVDDTLIACIFITFCSLASVFALIRALPRTSYATESWQSGIAPLNFIVAFAECCYLAYVLFVKRMIFNFQSMIMVGIFGFAYFIVILSVGTCMFYIVPFIPILFTFSQPKSN